MLNTPNILSLIRLCMVPAFVVVYHSGLEHARLYAVLIYALATFTDYLDGHLARKYNLITNLGKVLDPLGDKMFTVAVLVCLSMDDLIPGWLVLIVLGKEALMGLGGLVLHKKAKVEIPPSNYFGKTATVLFFVVCVALMLFDMGRVLSMALMGTAVLMSLVAFGSYLLRFAGIMKKESK